MTSLSSSVSVPGSKGWDPVSSLPEKSTMPRVSHQTKRFKKKMTWTMGADAHPHRQRIPKSSEGFTPGTEHALFQAGRKALTSFFTFPVFPRKYYTIANQMSVLPSVSINVKGSIVRGKHEPALQEGFLNRLHPGTC